MAKPIKRKAGHVTVEVAHRVPGRADDVEVREHLLQASDVGESPASVNYAASLTHNLGNYESLRVSVGVTLPARPTMVFNAGEVAKRIAHRMLDQSMDEWVGPRGMRSPHHQEPEAEADSSIKLIEEDPEFPSD